MDRATTKKLAQSAEKALQAVADEYGLAVKYKSGNYSDATAALRFEFSEIGDGGVVKTREAENFSKLAHLYGLKPEDLGATFKIGTKSYTITGLNGRARKMPIQATRSDGRTYKFPDAVVARALGRKA